MADDELAQVMIPRMLIAPLTHYFKQIRAARLAQLKQQGGGGGGGGGGSGPLGDGGNDDEKRSAAIPKSPDREIIDCLLGSKNPKHVHPSLTRSSNLKPRTDWAEFAWSKSHEPPTSRTDS